MPGISFICDFKHDLRNKESDILRSFDSMLHYDHYKRDILIKERSFVFGYAKYDGYPISVIKSEEFVIYLEGRIYGKDYLKIERDLKFLAKCIFYDQERSKDKVSEWLLGTDGDFIIYILQKKSHDIAILNDVFSRLPLYYYKTDNRLLLSREVRFITNLMDDRRFDRMAIAQYLLFGYSLGKRTLLKNIYRLGPATLIRIHNNQSQITLENIHVFNFESKKYENNSIAENAENLASLFLKACKDRADSDAQNIVALSGGLDSRSIAAGLYKSDIPFLGVTRSSFDNREGLDVKIAEQLACVFNIEWRKIRIDPPRGKDVLKMLKIKNGLNYLGMSFIIPFFETAKEIYGPKITYFTGDGGQFMKPVLKINEKIKSQRGLVEHILFNNSWIPLTRVVKLTQIAKNEIIEELNNHILAYAENDWNQKYMHFVFYDRAVRMVYEGEDRNRYYFWSLTPFFSVHFFDYLMNCPDIQKHKFNLYREFLSRISPQATKIEYTNYKLPLTSKKLPIKLYLLSKYHRLPLELKKLIGKHVLKNHETYGNASLIISCLKKQLNNCETIRNYLYCSEIDLNDFSKSQIDVLFTLASFMEESEGNSCVIADYDGAVFV